MFKQFLINRYFKKLTKEAFFQDDEDAIIGKAKYVIQSLKDQLEYAKNPENDIPEEDREFIIKETTELKDEISKKYRNKNNVIGVRYHAMAGFYVLQDKKSLFEDLKEYYIDMKQD